MGKAMAKVSFSLFLMVLFGTKPRRSKMIGVFEENTIDLGT